jgi:sRNA-binding carbon storage regulator CsrA
MKTPKDGTPTTWHNGLILTRGLNESIVISHPQGDIVVRYLGPSSRHRRAARIAIDAPPSARILRGELLDQLPVVKTA